MKTEKKIKRFCPAVVLACLVSVSLMKGQTLDVYDGAVLFNYKMTKTTDSLHRPIPTDTLLATAMIKINSPGLASKLYIKMGSAKDSGDVRSTQLSIINTGGTYYLQDGSISNKIWGLSAYYNYTLLKTEFQNVAWATFYAVDVNNVVTSKKYFKCQ